MNAIFSELTTEENLQLVDAIPLITLLVGTADGTLDTYETEWAERVVKFRSFSNNEDLHEYYTKVGDNFDERLNHFIRDMPDEAAARKSYLSDYLAQMNPLIAKLNGHDAYRIYHDFLSFAKHVAKASGGILYMANVSPGEKKVIELDMIDPVENWPGI